MKLEATYALSPALARAARIHAARLRDDAGRHSARLRQIEDRTPGLFGVTHFLAAGQVPDALRVARSIDARHDGPAAAGALA